MRLHTASARACVQVGQFSTGECMVGVFASCGISALADSTDELAEHTSLIVNTVRARNIKQYRVLRVGITRAGYLGIKRRAAGRVSAP